MSNDHSITPPTYVCQKHGQIIDVIVSALHYLPGRWCQICWLESLDRNGVCRVVPTSEWPTKPKDHP